MPTSARTMMRPTMHIFLGLLIAFALVLAGAAQAAAGVSMALAETHRHVVICAEGGAVEVVLDADGNLVKGEKGQSCRVCPDCILAQSSFDPVHAKLPRPDTLAQALVGFPVKTSEPSVTRGLPIARAPPVNA